MRFMVVLAVLAGSLCACAGSGNAEKSTSVDASAVIEQLRAAGAPVGNVLTLTAETDDNHLLGRPGQYVSKAIFHDSRLAPDNTSASLDDGGTVEVFAKTGDAGARKAYVEGIAKASSLFAEYDYQNGRILLRLTKRLTPEQAAEYEQRLKK